MLNSIRASIVILAFATVGAADEPAVDLEAAMTKAGKNRSELEKALKEIPKEQRPGMVFLVVNMPDDDLRKLSANFLIENITLAYKARKEVPWGATIPDAIFFNNVLPYANVDESRDPWRKELYELCIPLVKDCKTPSEAVQLLNTKVFEKLKVRYSTQRKKAQQSPKESMETGLASCTGLSILLSDACRSVAIPTRVVGTPLWANKRGNHTWLEIWDQRWRFTGACEPDPKGLDRGWFTGDAAQAKKDSPEHAIYAASFQKTKVRFPLVWAPDRNDIFAENVTDRYTTKDAPKADTIRVLVRVRQLGQNKRLALPVIVVDRDNPQQKWEGQSRDETADTNDILPFDLLREHNYLLQIGKPIQLEKTFLTSTGKEQILDIELPADAKKEPAAGPALSAEELQQLEKETTAYFRADAAKQATWQFDPKLNALLLRSEAAVRQIVWQAYRNAPIHAATKKDFEASEVRSKQHVSPYKLHEVGKRPKNGWPLVIAMHGGGGVPKNVNDSQWKVMEIYYKDQPTVTGYKYLALRAPNDSWNGFYDDYVPALIANLVRQFALFGDIDTDKVYIMGYSHGGYGAFYLGPKIPDRFAAVHASAGAPTDGTISPLTLRNTRFTFMIGEKDTAYGRRERCEKFDAEVQKIKTANPGDYPVVMELKMGFGHGGLPDRDKIKEMDGFIRNPVPRHLTWEMTDSVVTHFYWLSTTKPEAGQNVDAEIKDNNIRITTRKAKPFDLHLDARLIDYSKPVRITVDGVALEDPKVKPSLVTLCRTLAERGDPALAFSCTVPVTPPQK